METPVKCCMCNFQAEKLTKCGPLCAPCLKQYRSEYIQYKSCDACESQIALRKQFADRWFSGYMDGAHSWSLKRLAASNRPPEFILRFGGNAQSAC